MYNVDTNADTQCNTGLGIWFGQLPHTARAEPMKSFNLAILAILCVAACPLLRPLSAQEQPPARQVAEDTTAVIKPPPKHLVQQGMMPLSPELPSTTPPTGMLPPDASAGLFDKRVDRPMHVRGSKWEKQVFCWTASELRHQPVYFEDTMLERHGQTRHPLIQPMVSGAKFFTTFPLLPYAMTINPPRRTTSTLGDFRPGSSAPMLLQRPPLQLDAGTVEAGAIVGLILLVP
jgi:hypothetical protein